MISDAVAELLVKKIHSELMGLAQFQADARGIPPRYVNGSCLQDAYQMACVGIIKKDREIETINEQHAKEVRRITAAHKEVIDDMKAYQQRRDADYSALVDRYEAATGESKKVSFEAKADGNSKVRG